MGLNYVDIKFDEFAGYEGGWNGFGTRAPNKQALKRLREAIGDHLRQGFVLFPTDSGDVCIYKQLPFDQWDDAMYVCVETSEDKPLEALVFVKEHKRPVKVFPLADKAEADAFFAYLQEQGWQV